MVETEPKTVNLTPNNDGLLRWLRAMYKEDPANALKILGGGWPVMRIGPGEDLLEGKIELEDALLRSGVRE